MKTAIFALAFLTAAVSGNNFNLRAAATKSVDALKTPSEARVIIDGLLHDASKQDIQVIRESVVAAYNEAYANTGSSLSSFKVMNHAAIPETVTWPPDCHLCPDDDSMALTGTAKQGELILASVGPKTLNWPPDCHLCGDDAVEGMVQVGEAHKNFEDAFCAKIRNSGSPNLASVLHCSFSYLETPGVSEAAPHESTEAQIIMRGTLHRLSESDLKIVDNIIMATYNDAFYEAGYSLTAFEAMADLEAMMNDSMIVAGRISAASSFNKADLTKFQIAYMHTAFEKAFCSQLQNSGSANLANVHDCAFHFVYSPAVKSNVAQQ